VGFLLIFHHVSKSPHPSRVVHWDRGLLIPWDRGLLIPDQMNELIPDQMNEGLLIP
jgi:hypothetical protein